MTLFDGLARRMADRARELTDEALERAEAIYAQFPDVRLRREGDGWSRRWG